MKKLIFSSLIGLALLAFTGCTNGSDATVSKCQTCECDKAKKCDGPKKCDSTKKCSTGKCSAGKCGK